MSVKMALKGYTLEELAKVSGVSRATLSAIKNGKSCKYETAIKVAKALGLDATELIDVEAMASLESEV